MKRLIWISFLTVVALMVMVGVAISAPNKGPRYSPLKAAISNGIGGYPFQNTIWTDAPMLTLTPIEDGVILINMITKIPFSNVNNLNYICGIYINTTGNQPTGTAAFESETSVFFSEEAGAFSKDAILQYPFTVQAGQTYYIWFGFRHEAAFWASEYFMVGPINLIATLHSGSGL